MTRSTTAPTDRVRLRRLNERGAHDAAAIHAVLDAMPLCHVGYVLNGTPHVTPTLQWREGNHVYWHGSAASRFLEAVEGHEACLTVTLWDGMVMARSGFHHSANYRSVMAFGPATRVADAGEKEARLKAMFDLWFPGRWEMLRPATSKEIKATTVLSMPLDEASVKVRSGPPGDDEEDYALPIWAGVLPIRHQVLPAVDDPRNLADVARPAHADAFRIGGTDQIEAARTPAGAT